MYVLMHLFKAPSVFVRSSRLEWETENYHVILWVLAAFQSGDCFVMCAH